MADTTGTSGRWLSLAEAASALGVSVRTLRRRVASGEIRRQRSNGHVLFFVPHAATMAAETVTPTAMAAPVADMAQPMAEEAATVHPAVAALERALTAERERSALLETELRAAREAAAMYQERSRNLEAQVALPPPAKRPWWRRWW